MSFYFVYEVGRIACLGYSVVSLHHPVYQKQARGAHISKSLSFFDFGLAPPGGLLRRNKNVPWTSFFVSTWSNLMSSNKIAFTSCRSRAPREGRTPCGQGPHASFTNNMHVTTLHEPAGLSPAGHRLRRA